MATEGERRQPDFGNEGNQNDHRCKEKSFESLTPIINFSRPDLLTICEKSERCLDGPTC